jgi:hypothetical protein
MLEAQKGEGGKKGLRKNLFVTLNLALKEAGAKDFQDLKSDSDGMLNSGRG